MKNVAELLPTVKEMLDAGGQIDISFHDLTKNEAVRMITRLAEQLNRTWQEQEHNGTKWLAIVPHDDDQFDVSIYYQ